LIEGIVIPFNGVLLARGLVERIGVVEEKYFIWGDDVEYLWRAERAGARIATVTRARFVHPSVGDLGTPMVAGQTYNHSPSDLKAYCMARNNWVNLRTYRGLPHAQPLSARRSGSTLTPRPGRLLLMLRGIVAGMRSDFHRF
jgi:rhamnopyranosyl-N-acetylglucosaminyl-diphospho-decaprenol beta-1,3/1,4-galactofuranosyltransferase